ncbi:UDP-N-acetylmuramoyl-L-alanyl-D-glutamate--2,6-diaminopimelate ligase [Pseudidiomarina sp.]|uniref:UDP-N-acetylmuramoyl-L-alanyl-D-glutamate--2, 6-diaminopimelate ligase n=1 Tax=Pseudidiomarina sp. TaxID=2081707 RepID=UPI00299EA409|nr:UDP-N-acetylmuramoyl-L-alanyl-D-glutamate--2,6-diaminopimelate ligase [Pseudidiomarina sp.]MDX1705228.1 UDP-N-acetylmuramoyl-L-alanyl-D-glutamate--2,6-diaminopimelate ligase [Pseudidiomarina sp.]
MINIRQLLPDYPLQLPQLEIGGLKSDSRQVAPGDAFVAVPGYQTDGREFIDKAIQSGARVIFSASDSFGVAERGSAWVIEVPNLKDELSALASRFYGAPAQRAQIIGVTGTNGKTSVTYLIAQLLENLGVRAGVIGTTGSGFPGMLLPEQHTTPDAITVQQRLATLVAEGAQVVAMEVSSHALVQRRVEAIHFAVGAATNISRDHLDYHGTMANYAGAKRRLFTDLDTRHSVLNVDDAALAAWLPDRSDSWRVSLSPQQHDKALWASDIEFTEQGTSFTVNYGASQVKVQSALLGRFNVYNLLVAITSVVALDYQLADVAAAADRIHAVPGRMEAFGGSTDQPLIIVDYAHTPDALQQVLEALRPHCRGKLWCLFGCGGDRDRGKRPQMGGVAVKLADQVVVTDDNPRTEEPQQIVQDILAGMPARDHVTVIEGRREAVLATIAKAGGDDIVLLAGKGHEDYQVVGQQRLPYDERRLVANWFAQQQTREGRA